MVFTPSQMPPSNPPVVTVWVHGTRADSFPGPLQRVAISVRDKIFPHTLGLLHLSPQSDKPNYDSMRAHFLGTLAPTLVQQNYVYSFGWSGKLNLQARQAASRELFAHLKQLYYELLEKTGYAPIFILVGHSHGGNVILHLAEIQDPDGFELSIAKAILLGCPVQQNTAHLVNSPCFKRVYSLHSHTDMIQVMDMQGIHKKKHEKKPLFSQRHFLPHPKLVQAHIRWKQGPTMHEDDRAIEGTLFKCLTNSFKTINLLKKNRGLLHTEFILLPFLRHLSAIIAQLDDLFDKNSNCPSHQDDDIVIEL
jgi:hypothetical protein